MSGNIGSNEIKSEIEQVETVSSNEEKRAPSGSPITHSQGSSNIFLRFWHSIYQKPLKRQNAWKLLTNLNNTQRVTFTAGTTHIA